GPGPGRVAVQPRGLPPGVAAAPLSRRPAGASVSPPARPVVLNVPRWPEVPARRDGRLRRLRPLLPAGLGGRPEAPLPLPGRLHRRAPVPAVLLPMEAVLPLRPGSRSPFGVLRGTVVRPGAATGGAVRGDGSGEVRPRPADGADGEAGPGQVE